MASEGLDQVDTATNGYPVHRESVTLVSDAALSHWHNWMKQNAIARQQHVDRAVELQSNPVTDKPISLSDTGILHTQGKKS